MLNLSRSILSLGGTGFSPKAPGTVGSVVALVLLFLLINSEIAAWRFIYLALFLGLYLGHLFLIKNFVQKPYDKSWIVLDEFLGMQVTFLPFLFFAMTPAWAFFGFLLFRYFDILKPLGIKSIDEKGTPESVIHDDLLAGAYAGIILTILVIGGQLF